MSDDFILPEGWPAEWSGNTVIDTGTSGKFCCAILTDASPHIGHVENFKVVLAHMADVWPQAYDYIYSASREWEITRPLQNPHASLEIRLPTDPIDDGAEWSISAQWSGSSTWFNAEFKGWEIDLDSSQPYN
jgi:hypothetical protein